MKYVIYREGNEFQIVDEDTWISWSGMDGFEALTFVEYYEPPVTPRQVLYKYGASFKASDTLYYRIEDFKKDNPGVAVAGMLNRDTGEVEKV